MEMRRMRVRANIPARARQSAFWTSAWLALALAAVLAGCGAQVGDWQSISTDSGGPSFGMGAQPASVISLAADPRIAGLVYIGTDSAGVRRTTADTTGVEAANAGMAQGSSVFALTPDPSASGTVYAGTSTGFYRSTDASASWQARDTGLPEKEAITAVAAGPNGAPLLAGTMSHGLFLSANQGASWQPATGLPADGRVSAALWIEGAKTALVAFAGGHLYVARDDLRQWTQSDAGLPANSDIQALAASPYQAAIYAGSTQGLFASEDNGRTWVSVGGGLSAGSVGALASDPRQPNTFYAAVENRVYVSVDGARIWRSLTAALDKPARALAVATNRAQTPVTYATTGQLYRYPAAGGGGSFGPAIILVIAVVVIAALFIRSRRTTRYERQGQVNPEPKTPPVTDTRSPAERYGDADEM
jgi:ligand-binding sensor domain-containing protein